MTKQSPKPPIYRDCVFGDDQNAPPEHRNLPKLRAETTEGRPNSTGPSLRGAIRAIPKN